jgi:hypothetical protein
MAHNQYRPGAGPNDPHTVRAMGRFDPIRAGSRSPALRSEEEPKDRHPDGTEYIEDP